MADAHATPAAESTPAPTIDLAAVEAPVHFDLGTAMAMLGVLESLQPGYVFELDRRIESGVTITVGGATLGRGELVRVGDRLGVRVVEVQDDASRGS